MTLRELKLLITNYKRGHKLPSYNQLKASTANIILQLNIDFAELKVYDNGLISFSNIVGTTERHTVYDIFNLELRYEFNKYGAKPIKLADYPEIDDLEAGDLLIMCGQDRLDYNTNSRELSHINGTLDNDGNNFAPRSNTRHKSIFYQDFTDTVLDRLVPDTKTDYSLKLHNAMLQLTEKQLEVIKMRYYEDLTQQEIAEILGISRDSVKSRLEGAITKLKKYINK